MHKPKLALSNTTTFFSGDIERVFKKAKKHGFKYLELVPYRWTKPDKILALERKYQIQTVGIHMPEYWEKPALNDIFSPLWAVYLGPGKDSPGLKLAEKFKNLGREFYLLFHTNVAREAGESFTALSDKFHTVLENVPGDEVHNPVSVFDPGHFGPGVPDIKPEIIHIGYNQGPLLHILPNQKERAELKQMLKGYNPRYVVLETNPWVNVSKGKALIEKLLNHASE